MAKLMTLNPNYPVERSRLLDKFNFSDYTPDEMLLLDVYLSKINPEDPTTKRIQFRKREYEIFLQKSEQQYKTFKKAALGLYKKFVDCAADEMGFDPKHIWKELSFKKDGSEWVFTMECDEQMESFFFNTQSCGYIRYLVGYTKNFTSRYSFLLYYYFKRKRQEELKYGNPIRPTVAELKKLTGTGTKKTYKEFKYFKRDIIDMAVEEICAFTDIDVTYETVKIGRTVERIHFTVLEKSTPPLLGSEPSDELKGMFAEELAEMRRGLSAAEDGKVLVQLPDGKKVWVDRDAIIAVEEERSAQEPSKKRRGRPKKEQTVEVAPEPKPQATSSPEPASEPLTELEQDLFNVVPEEVHGGEIERVRAILSVAARYIHERFLDFFGEGVSYAEARRQTIEDCNDRILDAIRRYITEDYNVRRKGIRSPAGHYRYFLVGFEGWLMDHMED